LLLLDLRDACGETGALDVAGLESGDFFRRESERLIHPGDNLSIVEVCSVDITSNDIDVFVEVFEENG
jgi:hypothetical protein